MAARVTLAVLAAIACSCEPKDRALSPKERHDALLAEMFAAQKLEHKETIVAVERAYARLFPSPIRQAIVSRADRTSLDLLFDAADLVTSHTLDAKHLGDAISAFDAIATSTQATERQKKILRELMVKVRIFEPHPEIDVPRLQDESRGPPTELVVTSDSLIRRTIPTTGPQIIVVSHPRCRYSASAREDIAEYTTLAAIFSRQARWLVPQEASGDLDAVREAATHGSHYTLAYKRSEFPFIDSWETPTFYFLDGPSVVKKVVGWPQEGQIQELLDGARAIGLVPP